MNIDRCYCFDVLFVDIKDEDSIDDVKKKYSCGEKCGLCLPYIEVTLETGETSFDRIITKDA